MKHKAATLHVLQTPLYDTEILPRRRCVKCRSYYVHNMDGRRVCLVMERHFTGGGYESNWYALPVRQRKRG